MHVVKKLSSMEELLMKSDDPSQSCPQTWLLPDPAFSFLLFVQVAPKEA